MTTVLSVFGALVASFFIAVAFALIVRQLFSLYVKVTKKDFDFLQKVEDSNIAKLLMSVVWSIGFLLPFVIFVEIIFN